MADMASAGAVRLLRRRAAGLRTARFMRHALEYSRVDRPPDRGSLPRTATWWTAASCTTAVWPSILGLRGAPPRPRRSPSPATWRWPGRPAAGSTWPTQYRRRPSSWSGAPRRTGVAVTAEATPHHLLMTDEWVAGTSAGCRRSTPTAGRTRRSVPMPTAPALLEGLLDGTIDRIATDHAPHTSLDKDCEFDQAAPGISGSRRRSGCSMRLVDDRRSSTRPTLIRLLTIAPAQVVRPGGRHARGSGRRPIWSSSTRRRVDRRRPQVPIEGQNSPLHGERLHGLVRTTMVGGEVVHEVRQ